MASPTADHLNVSTSKQFTADSRNVILADVSGAIKSTASAVTSEKDKPIRKETGNAHSGQISKESMNTNPVTKSTTVITTTSPITITPFRAVVRNKRKASSPENEQTKGASTFLKGSETPTKKARVANNKKTAGAPKNSGPAPKSPGPFYKEIPCKSGKNRSQPQVQCENTTHTRPVGHSARPAVQPAAATKWIVKLCPLPAKTTSTQILKENNSELGIQEATTWSNGYVQLLAKPKSERPTIKINDRIHQLIPFERKPSKCQHCQQWGHGAAKCRHHKELRQLNNRKPDSSPTSSKKPTTVRPATAVTAGCSYAEKLKTSANQEVNQLKLVIETLVTKIALIENNLSSTNL
ncbi:uncharacterized protein LOC121372875 [Gigantopelta aegis]|uniref:uncharacterized protein LOC121372875 n=1 Tax=Gigantopelta aegis TaxID=1735272 RepID=UPI001B88E5B2|nr:uncharacterized protein LOC121372875 [Gigantopelta aegis]